MLHSTDVSTLLLGLAITLGLARAFGELCAAIRQPAIVGEIIAGIVLGPTVIGSLFPEFSAALFPPEGTTALAFKTINMVAVVLLLLIAGLEVDLSILWRQGRAALLVSLLGMIIPFSLGFGLAYLFPTFLGFSESPGLLTAALFLGVALSISALPVIAKILMDLSVFKTDVGMLIMGAAMFNDLVGWIIFSVILSLMAAADASFSGGGGGQEGFDPGLTILLTLGVVALMLTVVRWLVHRMLPWIHARLSWPGGVLAFTLALAFACASVTELIGIHAIFGAFLAGVAIGDSSHMREHTRTVLHQFVVNTLAPIFFVSIGLQVNFLAHFNLPLVLVIVAVGFAGKLIGCYMGARLGRLSKKESLAIGFGMNARGAMEIILGLLALQHGIIGEEMFIALVMLALLSSMIGGPAMNRFIVRPRGWRLNDLITADLFVPSLAVSTIDGVIRELSQLGARAAGLDPQLVVDAVLAREELMGTAIGEELAVPHARLDDLSRPVLVVGHSEEGIDFNSPDGRPVRLVFLLLTSSKDASAQIQIMGQIARCFSHADARRIVYERESIDVLRAFIKIESPKPAPG